MDVRKVLLANLEFTQRVVHAYLSDLTDSDLLVRPAPGANHIAWQLGHLIVSTQRILDAVDPGLLPPLPAGFAEKYSPQTATVDSPAAFHGKEEYLRLMGIQREMLTTAINKLNDADLDKPAPEFLRKTFKTMCDVFVLLCHHPLMHAGQWVVVRRKLGKPVLI